jgi:hypothetical protein
MRSALAFVGAGLAIRGVADWGVGFFAVAGALIAWRARLSPLRRIEAALAVALALVGAARGHPLEGTLSAAIAVGLTELARIFQ